MSNRHYNQDFSHKGSHIQFLRKFGTLTAMQNHIDKLWLKAVTPSQKEEARNQQGLLEDLKLILIVKR